MTKPLSPPPRPIGDRGRPPFRTPLICAGLALVLAAACLGSTAAASPSKRTAGFELRIGDVMSFTGDLGPYGPSLDAAAKLAATYINSTLQKQGLSDYSVQIVDSQDDQSKIPPAVEAATKLADIDKVSVIVGTISSGSTIAVAQSISIPRGIVQITPTSSSPGIASLADHNLVFQMFPSDTFQAQELVKAAGTSWGKHATVNVGWRNDDWGNGVSSLFIKDWKAAGGRVGTSLSWNPDSPSFDTDAQKLAAGNPKGWVIFDFPPTYAKMAPALVRAGGWSPAKTYVTAEMRDATSLQSMGPQATEDLHGVSSSNGSTPLQDTFAAYFKHSVKGKPYTGYEGTGVRLGDGRFPRRVEGRLDQGLRDRGPDQGADEPAREAVQLPAARARDQGDPRREEGRVPGRLRPAAPERAGGADLGAVRRLGGQEGQAGDADDQRDPRQVTGEPAWDGGREDA